MTYFKGDFLRPGKPIKPKPSAKPALEISDESINQVLDGLMAFPEEDQVEFFNERYLDNYHPDHGNLAELTRELLYNNLSNVIIVIDSISAAFDFIEELYFNKPIDFDFFQFWRENPKTKTGVEFLLCLASHYNFEKRGLVYLFGAYKEAKKLSSQQYYKTNVFNKGAKSFILKEIYEELVKELKEIGYHSLDEVLKRYTDEEIKIYNKIISLGGEEKNRGLYYLGWLYWDEGLYDLALKKWKEIDQSYSVKAFREIKTVLAGYDDIEKIIPQIDSIHEWESHENSEALLERLLKYHKWKKRGKKRSSGA